MSEPGNSRWRFAILPIVMLSITLPNLLRNRGLFAAMWPAWRATIEQFVLLVAVVVVLAAIISGAVTWRRERKNHA